MRLLLSLMILPLTVYAQTAIPTEFPADAVQLSDEALTERMAGKVYKAKLTDGTTWRVDYKKNGFAFLNLGSGFSDSGKWSTKEGKLCSVWKVAPSACSETRVNDEAVYIKRVSTGEVVALRAE